MNLLCHYHFIILKLCNVKVPLMVLKKGKMNEASITIIIHNDLKYGDYRSMKVNKNQFEVFVSNFVNFMQV